MRSGSTISIGILLPYRSQEFLINGEEENDKY